MSKNKDTALMKKLKKNRGLDGYSFVRVYMPNELMFQFADELESGHCEILLCNTLSAKVTASNIKNRKVIDIILN